MASEMVKKQVRVSFYLSCNYFCTLYFLVKMFLVKLKNLKETRDVEVAKIVVFIKTYNHNTLASIILVIFSAT